MNISEKSSTAAEILARFDPESYDDDRLERFLTTDDAGAGIEFLRDEGIDPAPVLAAVGAVKLLNTSNSTALYRPELDHSGTGVVHEFANNGPPAIAFPIIEDGRFVDLLLIGTNDFSFDTLLGETCWLGRDALTSATVRLHKHPLDWLDAGCTGVCHIAPFSRAEFAEFRGVERIECSDIHLAMEVLGWAFDGDEDELKRFFIDDEPQNIREFFLQEEQFKAEVARINAERTKPHEPVDWTRSIEELVRGY